MKLLKRNISAKDGSGTITLLPTTPEDLWHTYNLLQLTDLVRCTTLRKVSKESSTGSVTSSKVRMNLTIEVTKLEFDKDTLQVRISGPNSAENQHVKMGAFHTLTLELDRQFTIEKICWDQIYLDRIDEACHPEREAEVAVVVMGLGLAHVCLVTGSVTVTKARIEVNVPKKRTGSSAHGKSVVKFYGERAFYDVCFGDVVVDGHYVTFMLICIHIYASLLNVFFFHCKKMPYIVLYWRTFHLIRLNVYSVRRQYAIDSCPQLI